MARARTASLSEVAGNGTDWRPQPGDTVLVIALARGASVPEAAAEAGVSDRTTWRRLADPAFRRCVLEARAELVAGSLAKIAHGATRAVDALIELLEAEDPKVRLAAAREVLDRALPQHEAWQQAADDLRPVVECNRDEAILRSMIGTRPAGPVLALPDLLGGEED